LKGKGSLSQRLFSRDIQRNSLAAALSRQEHDCRQHCRSLPRQVAVNVTAGTGKTSTTEIAIVTAQMLDP
jgi:hypothetical protein